MNRWYVVHTHVNSETKALEHLRRQGYRAYLPRYRKWRRHARRRELVLRALFPRYLFVALNRQNTRWRPILSTIGVCDIVRTCGEPAPVPKGVVEEIEAREADGTLDRLLANEALNFNSGESVRVTSGPFAELIGRFFGIADSERVFVLLDLLGREVKTRLSIEAIARA